MMQTDQLRQSAMAMKLMGWSVIVGLPILLGFYPPGFFWGSLPTGFPHVGPAHPESPYDGLHPYLFMIIALYLAWAILLLRGSRDPKANAALLDFGILANLLHGLVMLAEAFIYPNEHAHIWADVPLLFAFSLACWIWHPNRSRMDADAR
jgi:hypothetical protein